MLSSKTMTFLKKENYQSYTPPVNALENTHVTLQRDVTYVYFHFTVTIIQFIIIIIIFVIIIGKANQAKKQTKQEKKEWIWKSILHLVLLFTIGISQRNDSIPHREKTFTGQKSCKWKINRTLLEEVIYIIK